MASIHSLIDCVIKIDSKVIKYRIMRVALILKIVDHN
jgi:hypothetical protein